MPFTSSSEFTKIDWVAPKQSNNLSPEGCSLQSRNAALCKIDCAHCRYYVVRWTWGRLRCLLRGFLWLLKAASQWQPKPREEDQCETITRPLGTSWSKATRGRWPTWDYFSFCQNSLDYIEQQKITNLQISINNKGHILHCKIDPKPQSQVPSLNGTACWSPNNYSTWVVYWRQVLLWLHIFEATAMLAVESSVPSKSLVNQEHRLESAFQIIHVQLSAFWNLDHYPDDLHLVILHGCNVTWRNRFQMFLSAWD